MKMLLLIVVVLLAGCTTTYEPPKYDGPYYETNTFLRLYHDSKHHH